jgi:hypothetical protein
MKIEFASLDEQAEFWMHLEDLVDGRRAGAIDADEADVELGQLITKLEEA